MPPRGAKLVVWGLLSCCLGISSSVLAQQSQKPSTADSPKTPYAVEDLILGDNVDPDTVTSRTYHCSPSEQFVGFTWCTNRTSRGRGYTAYSILHSADDKIVYANKTLEPAFSSSAEAKEERQRIAQKVGTQPRIIDMPHRPGLPDGMIAVWGNVVLTPVDADDIKKLADGKSPKLGFMVDFLADFERSAKKGLPVYKLGGGAGLVLALSYGRPEQGTLRLIAVDASEFTSPVANVIAQPPTAPDQNPIGAQPSPAPERTATAAQASQNTGQSPNDAQPSLERIAKEDEQQTKITELRHTISSLRLELATSAAKVTKLENQLSESERQLKQDAQARLNAEAAKRQTEQTMLQSRNATQLWTILADVLVGSLIALLVILAPTLWNRFKNANIASKLPDVDQWLGYFERWLSSTLEKFPVPRGFPRANSGGVSVKHVAETEVTTQPT